MSNTTWSPTSWHSFKIEQHPTYKDTQELERVKKELHSYPPLVFAGEARNLQERLAKSLTIRRFCCKGAIAQSRFLNLALTGLKTCLKW